jgi:hypothetical protein
MAGRHHGQFVLVAAALLSGIGCGSSAALGVSSGTGGHTSSSSTSSSGAGGAAVDPFVASLAGYWVQQSIGNCIDAEEWYAFGSPAGFVHTIVDRNACGPHSVHADPGTTSTSATHVVSLAWPSPMGSEARTFTAVVLDPFPSPPAAPDPSYVPGPRALSTMAYHRAGAPLTWHRESTSQSTTSSPPASFGTTLALDVTLDVEPAPSKSPLACTMTLAFAASASPATGPLPSSATESWSLPCHFASDATTPWIRVTADGFEQSDVDSTWTDFMTKQGVDAKYAPAVVNMLDESFRPILYVDPAGPDDLFHGVTFAWFHEMKNPPPATVP